MPSELFRFYPEPLSIGALQFIFIRDFFFRAVSMRLNADCLASICLPFCITRCFVSSTRFFFPFYFLLRGIFVLVGLSPVFFLFPTTAMFFFSFFLTSALCCVSLHIVMSGVSVGISFHAMCTQFTLKDGCRRHNVRRSGQPTPTRVHPPVFRPVSVHTSFISLDTYYLFILALGGRSLDFGSIKRELRGWF